MIENLMKGVYILNVICSSLEGYFLSKESTTQQGLIKLQFFSLRSRDVIKTKTAANIDTEARLIDAIPDINTVMQTDWQPMFVQNKASFFRILQVIPALRFINL